jgi:hypothetical protein
VQDLSQDEYTRITAILAIDIRLSPRHSRTNSECRTATDRLVLVPDNPVCGRAVAMVDGHTVQLSLEDLCDA